MQNSIKLKRDITQINIFIFTYILKNRNGRKLKEMSKSINFYFLKTAVVL